MDNSELYDLIHFVEDGKNFHISVVFLENYGNAKTALPSEYLYHSKPICRFAKTAGNISGCFKCKNLALIKAVKCNAPFLGVCVNGIYEYCHPIINDGAVIGVIFIGNIMPPPELSKRLKRFTSSPSLINSLEPTIDEKELNRLGNLIENYILYLVNEFPLSENFDPIIQNIKAYIEENLTFSISSALISKTFNYSEKYLGRLFKKKTGFTIKEYINHRRLKMAQKMLQSSDMPITDIASKVGYNNISYFNRIFKNAFSVSPSQYRKNHKNI